MSLTNSKVSMMHEDVKTRTSRPGKCSIPILVVIFIVSLCVGIGIGFAIGKNKYDSESESVASPSSQKQMEKNRLKTHKVIFDSLKADNIKENLRKLTSLPHYPGSDESKKIADEMMITWKTQGFDKTESFKYNIYLSYPTRPGEISLKNGTAVENTLVINNEPPFDDSEKGGKILYPFNAFSAAGTVTGELVYGNYGRDSDFEALKKVGIDVKGKIMIFRYGKTSRTMKVRRSEQRDVIGVIIFSDPADYSSPGMEYPKGWLLNRYGVQRGTVNRLPGDALSIGYPSKDNYFRIDESKYSGNPKIPSQPISYSTAYELLRWMSNTSLPQPAGFQGALNLTYPLASGTGRMVTLNVSTILQTKETYTVCGTIYGSEEPDRYVMIGNHRDAWTYGAADPSSGTAAMMEIVRALGAYKKEKNWRPRRSIMACSWGAEEPGILGSTEWADENHKFLTDKVVAYLNIDMAVEGNYTVRLKALDSVSEDIFRVAKSITAPDDSSKTLYEDWLAKSGVLKGATVDKPTYTTPTSGSDYKALWHSYGTTMVDLRYLFSKRDYPQLSTDPHYHTRYESFGWMTKFVDPDYRYHQTISKLWSGFALSLSDSLIIPYDLVAYTKQVKSYLTKFEKTYQEEFKKHNISLAFAQERVDSLIKKTQTFHQKIKNLNIDKISAYKLRAINDKIMNFERNFIMKGLAKSSVVIRHAIYATTYNSIKSGKFPGITEAIYYATKSNSSDWDEVKKHITIVTWCFDTANRSLDFDE